MESGRGSPTRRTLVGAGLLGLGSAVLAACSGDPGSPEASKAGTTASSASTRSGTETGSGPERGPGGKGPRVTGTIAAGLDTPWSIAFLPDGDALVSERDTGLIRRISARRHDVVATVPGVVHGGEGGLLGLAVNADFADMGELFIYSTAADGNRVSSFAFQDDGGPGGNGALDHGKVLFGGIESAAIHNGGRIKFGRDGLLYVGTGDAGNGASAQDRNSPNGKVLRITAEGKPAPGNPFGNAVYSYGHRNVQGIAWDAGGRLWISELGPDRDDELNLVVAGRDYGWPEVTGAPHSPGHEPAVHVWPSTADASPSALAISGGTAYVACLRGQRLWTLPLPADGAEYDAGGTLPGAAEHFRGTYGRLREITVAPDGSLWVATNEGADSRILRLAA